MSSSLLQVVNNFFQTCYNKLGTSSANTTCWQLVNRLVTTCLQTCNNLCVFTRVVRWIIRPTKILSNKKKQNISLETVVEGRNHRNTCFICFGSLLNLSFFSKICRMVIGPVRETYNHVVAFFAQERKQRLSLANPATFAIAKCLISFKFRISLKKYAIFNQRWWPVQLWFTPGKFN